MAVHAPRRPALTAPGGKPGSARWLALTVLCVSILIVNLDITVLNVALPTLVRDLHATSHQLQWIVDAYALVYGGLVLVGGSLADRIGRKRTFMAGLLLFAGGSAWAAFSGSVGLLIAARASMGIGAAVMMPSTLAIITDMFRERGLRQRAIGIWSATSRSRVRARADHRRPAARALLVGIGVPDQRADRRGRLPVRDRAGPGLQGPRGAAARPDRGAAVRRRARARAVVDHRGAGVRLVVGPGDRRGGRGLAVLAGFAAWERVTSHPMLNLRFFRQPSFSAPIGALGLAMFGLVGALFVLTQFLQFNLGYSPLQAGVRMLPTAAAIVVIAPLSSIAVRRAGTKLTIAAGLLLIGAGLWQTSYATTAWTFTSVLPGLILTGVGAGLVIPAVSGSVMNSLPREHTGVGSATNGVSIQVGGALGVAVIGSLLSTRYQDRMIAALARYRYRTPSRRDHRLHRRRPRRRRPGGRHRGGCSPKPPARPSSAAAISACSPARWSG